jgi:hypothetical protein
MTCNASIDFHAIAGVSGKASVEELALKIEEAHDLLYPEEAGRSNSFLNVVHPSTLCLP